MSVVKFSYQDQGDMQLSPYFKVKEFRCKDGSDAIFIDLSLVVLLDQIREHYGRPVSITSGYRTPEHNKKVGGAEHSQHVEGKAADFTVKGVDPKTVYAWLDTWHTGGLGVYEGWTHIDTRAKRRRWKG